ncbi:MAG: hypothetical protein ACOVLB_02875 [Candidatus Nanopelagicus sp.]
MRSLEFINESAVKELAHHLPSLSKHNYDIIDTLVRKVASKHKLTGHALSSLFSKKYNKTPSDWIKNKLDEDEEDLYSNPIVQKFIDWSCEKLNLKTKPEIEFSYDTEEAQSGHHTGRHVNGEDKVWIYVKNRNLVDIFRTVFHELVHLRQDELNMIKPGSSYPGSPIEAEADMMAGKYIKIFGKAHPEIFQ